jgi:hypothetical protein
VNSRIMAPPPRGGAVRDHVDKSHRDSPLVAGNGVGRFAGIVTDALIGNATRGPHEHYDE